jgi:hypothetical protein
MLMKTFSCVLVTCVLSTYSGSIGSSCTPLPYTSCVRPSPSSSRTQVSNSALACQGPRIPLLSWRKENRRQGLHVQTSLPCLWVVAVSEEF